MHPIHIKPIFLRSLLCRIATRHKCKCMQVLRKMQHVTHRIHSLLIRCNAYPHSPKTKRICSILSGSTCYDLYFRILTL